MAEVLIDIDKISSQLATKLGPDIIGEISKRQRGAGSGGPSSGGSSGSKKESSSKEREKRKESLTDKTVDSYKEGGNAVGIEQDTSELRSGRFSGIIGRKIDSAKKIKDKIQEQKRKRAEKYGDIEKPENGLGTDGHGLGIGSSNNGRTKYNILEVKEARITNLHMKGGVGGSGSFGGGVGIPGRGGGDSSAPGGTPPAGGPTKSEGVGMMGKAATAIPIVGAAFGAIIGAVSTMAGMHQQVMQAQEGTYGAYGSVASGGGGLVRNPELAQLSITRAKVLGGEARDQNFENSSSSELGARFGVTQGIGGTAGAEMFAKMEKFGGFNGDQNSLKKIMADGIRSGFGGLRQAEFMQQVSGISENAYNSGMGTQSADQVAGTFSNLRGAGIRDNRLGSVYGAMNDNMTKEGGQMNSMLVAHHMQQNGGDYLAAMASAEEGMGSSGNTSAINQMTQGMDPKTKAIWLKKQGIITATEGNNSVQLGKDVMNISQSTATKAEEGSQAASNVSTGGFQRQISHANQLDEMAMEKAFSDAYEAQDKIFNLMISLAKKANETYETVKGLL